jgi:alanyl aminopeptidase
MLAQTHHGGKMKRLNRVAVGVIAAAGIGLLLSGSAWAGGRLSTQVVPTTQAITLKIDADQLEYSGTAQFELEVKEETATLTFHAEDISLDELTVMQNGATIPSEHSVGDLGIVTVTTSKPLSLGTASMTVVFSDLLDTLGHSFYQVKEGGDGYTFTQFEPDDAREAIPCWDEPSFKIPFDMTIIVPEAHVAVFNTPVVSESIADGWKTVVFERTHPMPSYLLALATGPLEFTPIPGMSIPGNIISVKGKSHLTGEAVRNTPPIVAALEKYFGQKYPYQKCDLIAVPGKGGAMENPGLITYASGLLLLDPETISVSQRRSLSAVNAHELAHIWFGDLVTLAWWDDTWLNESFASWIGDKITHEVFPEFGMDVSTVRSGQGAMIGDARPSTRAIRRPVEATDNLNMSFDALAYSKGQAVLGMFEQWLGHDVLRAGVIDFLKTHAWGNATADDFWAALSRASGKDVGTAMATFFDQPGVPWIEAELTLDNRVRLRQKRFSNYGVPVPDDALWQVPVVLKYSDGIETKTQTVMLDGPEMTVELHSLEGDPVWLLPNAGMHGYYRWSVPPAMLERLASKSAEELEVRERVGLIGNLRAQLDAGTIAGDDFLRTLNHFADDPDPQVISALLSGLGKVRSAFVTNENEAAFAQYVRRTLGPALERFGLTRVDGEDETVTRFRSQLIGWLGEEGKDQQVNAYADSLATIYLGDASAVDPQLAGVCLGLSVHGGDRAMFDECRKRFESAEQPRVRSRFLSVLGGFRDPELVDTALIYALDGPLRPGELFSILGPIVRSRQYEDYVFDWFIEHYDEIMSKLPPQYAAFMPFMAGGCSKERLARAHEFFAMPEHNIPGTDEQMAKVSDQVTDCTGLRDREGVAVGQYLNEVAATE